MEGSVVADRLLPPLPEPSELTRFFWDGVRDHRLMILRCDQGHYIHWPREVCPTCLSTTVHPEEVCGRARLATYTFPSLPFDPFYASKVPYILAVVELEEQKGLQMVTNIVDCDEADLKIGMHLQVTFREVAPGAVLPLFKPAVSTA
jgi:uncharacterized OB-fold protein